MLWCFYIIYLLATKNAGKDVLDIFTEVDIAHFATFHQTEHKGDVLITHHP